MDLDISKNFAVRIRMEECVFQLAVGKHINYDEHGRHNTDKETSTQSSRLHDYRETSEERAVSRDIGFYT
ncbi:hypothetical protein TNCV_781431 [Trichonephila clavipes]|nr:hypothetical protein TNCV_781431 [Trichonephila clavipes]